MVLPFPSTLSKMALLTQKSWYDHQHKIMKYLYSFVFGFLLVLGTACINNEPSAAVSVQTIKVDISQAAQTAPTEILSEVEYIVLEEKDLILDMPKNTILTQEAIYLLDESQYYIVKYSLEGELLAHVEPAGYGPSEYMELDWLVWDDQQQRLVAFSVEQQKFMWYDADLRFIEEKKSPVSFLAFDLLPEGTIVGFTNELLQDGVQENIIFLDKEMHIQSAYLPFDDNYRYLEHELPQNISSYQDELRCFLSYRYTIYRITEAGVSELYEIDLGEQQIPAEQVSRRTAQEVLLDLREQKRYYLSGYFELDQGAFINLSSPTGDLLVYHDKQEQQTKVIKGFSFVDDMLFLNPVAATSNTLIGFVPSEYIATLVGHFEQNDIMPGLREHLRDRSGALLLLGKVRQ